jgi:hypothetical protein
MAAKSDKNKIIILSVLGLVMISVLVYQLFLSSPPPKPSLGNSNRNSATASSKGSGVPVQSPETAEKIIGRSSKGNAQEQEFEELLSDITPLAYVAMHSNQSAAVGVRGNIFEFWKAPPPPPPKPLPPPPITLAGVSPQNATAGTPRPFTLTIYGKNIPVDAEVIFDGRARETKRVNDGALAIEVLPADYGFQKTITIEVKSKSDPGKLYSNQTSFVVSPAPEPPFRFVGIIGEQAVLEAGAAKEVIRVRVGEKLQGVWRVDAIGVSGLELTQTQFDIKKRVPLQEKAK